MDDSTEQRIKEAARRVFLEKGSASTRTQDIAEEASINRASVNYYFRSKKKLFDIIISETLSHFIRGLSNILNNENTTLEQKLRLVVSSYIDLMLDEPEISTFLINELRSKSNEFYSKFSVRQVVENSAFTQQYTQAVEIGKIAQTNPIHFLMNILGLVVFPFTVKPIFMELTDINTEDFRQLMLDRKLMIPNWIEALMKVK